MTLTPQATDTRLTRWKKILKFWQENIASPAYATNDPKATDTLRVTLVKLLRAIQGIDAGGFCCNPQPPVVVYAYTLDAAGTWYLQLNWSADGGPASDVYRVQWDEGRGTWIQITGTAPNFTEETISNTSVVSFTPPAGYVWIEGDPQHYNGGDNAEFFDPIPPGSWNMGVWLSFNIFAGPVPLTGCTTAQVTNLAIVDTQPNYRGITWECAVDPAQRFQIRYYDLARTLPVQTEDIDPTERGYQVLGLDENTQYCFIMTAVGDNNCVTVSNEICDS